MAMNNTPGGERVHIGFFGKRNAGKSSVLNAITGQDLAVVSEVSGTTTDPVYKAMEILPLGPVMLIDTPGIDDVGALGELRVRKTKQILNKTDVAALVVDATVGLAAEDEQLLAIFRGKNLPHLIIYNKIDLLPAALHDLPTTAISISAQTKRNIEELKNRLATLMAVPEIKMQLVGDLINAGDFVVLVTPIDKAAPRGRLILPQQQVIRDILESDATAVVVKEYELRDTLAQLKKTPRLIITDSQVFAKVSADTPKEIPLTSFSILFARYKGALLNAVRAAKTLETLVDNDLLLIAEGCTHHRQCDDIGTVKLPRWIRDYTKKNLRFTFTGGGEFPDDLSGYKLIVHCGGCMLTEREIKYRVRCANDQQVPFTNYGILIAYMQGILPRCTAMFPAVGVEFGGK